MYSCTMRLVLNMGHTVAMDRFITLSQPRGKPSVERV